MQNTPSFIFTSTDKAAEILSAGGICALPTETVYGLAASIDRPEAIDAVFQIKERPFFDPLIVHVGDVRDLSKVARSIPRAAKILAETFWPGPLTLVLPKRMEVNSRITSGLDTVAVRMPNHALCLEVIRKVGPVCAPSANKFGKVSPTTAEHVAEEFPVLSILEGGACEIGIESTVVAVSEETFQVLRPGMITALQIEGAVRKGGIHFKESTPEALERSPGHLKHHYQPAVPLLLVSDMQKIPIASTEIRLPDDPCLAARELYALMREASQQRPAPKALIVRLKERWLEDPQWRGILDRLHRAATPNYSSKVEGSSALEGLPGTGSRLGLS